MWLKTASSSSFAVGLATLCGRSSTQSTMYAISLKGLFVECLLCTRLFTHVQGQKRLTKLCSNEDSSYLIHQLVYLLNHLVNDCPECSLFHSPHERLEHPPHGCFEVREQPQPMQWLQRLATIATHALHTYSRVHLPTLQGIQAKIPIHHHQQGR